jgi:Domain of unknown function (DUF1998)
MSMTERRRVTERVGSVRPSQLVYTFGVGSVVDLPNFSVVVGGLDNWERESTVSLHEDRLLAAARVLVGQQVRELRTPPWMEQTSSPFDEWARVGVPVYPFPRWFRCTECSRLAPYTGPHGTFTLRNDAVRVDQIRFVHDGCPRKRGRRSPPAIPARFHVACPRGHLDEFPWIEFAHLARPCTGNPVLELYEARDGTRSTDMLVQCTTCGQKQHLSQAFGERAEQTMPRCRGRDPHLRNRGACDQQVRAMLLGASNTWFPVTRSALTIPTAHGEIVKVLDANAEALESVETPDDVQNALRFNPNLRRRLERFDRERVWEAIVERKGAGGRGGDPDDLLRPEWETFTAPGSAMENEDFRLRESTVPGSLVGRIARVVVAERLREVTALCGFTRIESPEGVTPGDANGPAVAALANHPPTWIPAAESRGEGVFIQLDEDAVSAWESEVAESDRVIALELSLRRWRVRRRLDPGAPGPGARLVLVHSLAHALIQQVALESGYSAAAVRERVYARDEGAPGGPMAGFLLYTSAPDSEGTLGGLMRLGESSELEPLFSRALERLKLCSSDPLCATHVPGAQEESLHAAACHSCLFLPETSCERGNRFLDRALVVPVLGESALAFFSDA